MIDNDGQVELEDDEIPEEVTFDDFEISAKIRSRLSKRKAPIITTSNNSSVEHSNSLDFNSSNNSIVRSPTASIEIVSLISESDETEDSQNTPNDITIQPVEEIDIPQTRSSIRHLMRLKMQSENARSNSRSPTEFNSFSYSDSPSISMPSLSPGTQSPSSRNNINNNGNGKAKRKVRSSNFSPFIPNQRTTMKDLEQMLASNDTENISESIKDSDPIEESSQENKISTPSPTIRSRPFSSQTRPRGQVTIDDYRSLNRQDNPHSYVQLENTLELVKTPPRRLRSSQSYAENVIDSQGTPAKQILSGQSNYGSFSNSSSNRRVSISQSLSPVGTRKNSAFEPHVNRGSLVGLAGELTFVDPDVDQDRFDSDSLPYHPSEASHIKQLPKKLPKKRTSSRLKNKYKKSHVKVTNNSIRVFESESESDSEYDSQYESGDENNVDYGSDNNSSPSYDMGLDDKDDDITITGSAKASSLVSSNSFNSRNKPRNKFVNINDDDDDGIVSSDAADSNGDFNTDSNFMTTKMVMLQKVNKKRRDARKRKKNRLYNKEKNKKNGNKLASEVIVPNDNDNSNQSKPNQNRRRHDTKITVSSLID
ncbi:hypothetical protein DFJ63DRAFT_317457 [Scheffersomyces coipomensis]|uniref:uncharacterized protein n=1 Tax=Scheffersomyces coipomensis TaxID=1788519 RepID=UPI00315D7D1E